MRSTPSMMQRASGEWSHRSKMPPSSVGNRIKSPIDSATPSTTETVTTAFSSFSEPNFFSNHCSNLDGCSCSSSGKNSAEYMSAFTPFTMDDRKLTTPRMSGSARKPVCFLTGSSLRSSVPSALRRTMARCSGPCMRMPSMSA